MPTPFLVVAGFLCGSRTLLGSRLIGGFFLVRNILSGSCLALLGSGSILDGGLLRELFDCLATRRCCVAGLTLLSFRGANLYIRDPSFLFEGAKKRDISSTAGSTSTSQFSTTEAANVDSDTGNWVTQSQVGRNRVTELLTTLFPSLLSLLSVPPLW